MNARESTLQGTREQIGCRLVDVVRLDGRIDAWIDDEGMYAGERNDLATVAAVALGRSRAASPLYGTVLFPTYDEAGDTRSLSPDQYKAVIRAFQKARTALTRAEALSAVFRQQ
ncbi:DUF3846 domain-containing protein [Curtobacterium flaccumfaciens pv. betae]|uniref:DUF3846 domain-containing protein n=1 Tax=Curtobacterium flaccumfaciens TaxID=2035 RepID=UPI0022037874|nr:DUF3846 domain-containing protein [Curtobacterium flaccumfaciens]MCS5511707.1 DUF3846 domain-containing protein [Curtobacterium flaccumfaciens pv. betae]UWT74376.1 DUF3846 domain-containing protein [Curtobacterium flaccumfaciens pv. betae]